MDKASLVKEVDKSTIDGSFFQGSGGRTLSERSMPLPVLDSSPLAAAVHGEINSNDNPLASSLDVAHDEEKELQKALLESAMVPNRGAPVLNEDEELQRAIKESEREARLASVARARDEKDLKRTLEISAKEDLAGSETSQEEDDESDSTTGWTSSEEEESDEEEESEEAKQLRIAARIRVLEAAGILKLDTNDNNQKQLPMQAQDKMLRRKATTRKPRPERPERRIHHNKPKKPSRPPPAPPKDERLPEEETDDAYDRYLKMSKEVTKTGPLGMDRISSSFSTTNNKNAVAAAISPPSSPPPLPSGTPTLTSTGVSLLSTIRGIARMGGSASPAERKTTPTISGPMSVRINNNNNNNSPKVLDSPTPTTSTYDSSINSSETQVTSLEHGISSWSSLIGSQGLSDIPELERNRQEAIFELIKTEGTHVRDLQTIVQVFFNQMKDEPFLSSKAQTVIFANVEEVLLTAVSLLSDLESRQRELRLYVTNIGDILHNHMKNMNTYLPYCVNQSTARQILTSERNRSAELEALLVHLRSQHPAARGLDLSSFLLVPMQRLTRYPLLISQILRFTNEDVDPTEWKNLHSSMITSQRLLDTVNEAIRARESNEKLALISRNLSSKGDFSLNLTRPTRWMGPRTIIKEEVLFKQKSGRKIEVVLCSDLLLLLVEDCLYRIPMPLEEVIVRDVPYKLTGRDDLSFQVVHQGREKTNLRCTSARACHTWMHSIESARSDCLAAANKSYRPRSSVGSP